MLKKEASNWDSDDHDDLVQSPHRPNKPLKNTSIVVGKITKIASTILLGLSVMLVANDLEVQEFHFRLKCC